MHILSEKAAFFIAITSLVISPLVVMLTNAISLYALSLPLIFFFFWWVTKLSRKEIGLQLGKPSYYLMGLGYPIVVHAVLALIAFVFGGARYTETIPLSTFFLALLIDVPITATLLMISEEGVFRGLLWGIFKKDKVSFNKRMVVTSLLFALWHIPALTIFAETKVALISIPFYLINAVTVGMIWAMFREKSASIIPISLSHAVWNTLAYTLFGYGEKSGMLGVPENTMYIFDPERGLLGVGINLIMFLGLFLLLVKTKESKIR